MKKIINFLVVVFLFSFSFNVYAESHDVVAKYNESQNIVTYDGTISKGVSSIKVDKGTFILNTVSSDFEGVNVVIIKLSGDALDWLKKYSNGVDNYYFYFNKNELDVNINDKITITYSSSDKNEKQLVVFNSQGSSVSKGKGSVSAYKTMFYVSVSDIEKEEVTKNTLELEVGSNGKVMIDGTMYEKDGKYSTDKNSAKIAAIANKGYEVSEIYFDEKDITSSLKDGFVEVSLKSNNKLRVEFAEIEEETSSEGYNISGKVILDGKPVEDAVVILNDDARTTTNVDGEYSFDNVPAGLNSILIMKNGKGIGFATFKIVASDIKGLDTYDGDVFTIEMGQNNLNFVMDLNVNDDFSIDFEKVELAKGNNYIWLIALGGILILGVVAILVKRKKN